MSTDPWGTCTQEEASKVCISWRLGAAPWVVHCLLEDCRSVLLSDTGAVAQLSSGNEAWLHDGAYISGQSDGAQSEAVSGGVNGYASGYMDWHQLSTSAGWANRTDPGWWKEWNSSLHNIYVSVNTRQ